jgi:hypothetical protein
MEGFCVRFDLLHWKGNSAHQYQLDKRNVKWTIPKQQEKSLKSLYCPPCVSELLVCVLCPLNAHAKEYHERYVLSAKKRDYRCEVPHIEPLDITASPFVTQLRQLPSGYHLRIWVCMYRWTQLCSKFTAVSINRLDGSSILPVSDSAIE